ncbi:hypothetical protein D9M68_993480 [compost metagenome]
MVRSNVKQSRIVSGKPEAVKMLLHQVLKIPNKDYFGAGHLLFWPTAQMLVYSKENLQQQNPYHVPVDTVL